MRGSMKEAPDSRFVDRRPRERLLSEDGEYCLSEAGIKHFTSAGLPRRKLVLVSGWGELEREFVFADVHGDLCFVDVLTGSLYNPAGRSLSGSPLYIKVGV